jgi:Fur family ferric uptake transcriptional regulator
LSQIESILKNSTLSVTTGRKRILEIFLSSNNALAHQDIESQCADEYDRVTIYRTLQTFLEKGIIHNIPSTDNITRYALFRDIIMITMYTLNVIAVVKQFVLMK